MSREVRVKCVCARARGLGGGRWRRVGRGGRRRRAQVGEGANGATGGVGEEDGVGGGFFGEREGVFSRVSRAFGGDSNAATDGVVRGGVADHAAGGLNRRATTRAGRRRRDEAATRVPAERRLAGRRTTGEVPTLEGR